MVPSKYLLGTYHVPSAVLSAECGLSAHLWAGDGCDHLMFRNVK